MVMKLVACRQAGQVQSGHRVPLLLLMSTYILL